MRLRSWLFDLFVCLCAVAIALVRPSPPWIEAHYANGLYPVIDRVVRTLTGPLPFCLGDVLFVMLILWLVRYVVVSQRRARGSRLAALGRTALRIVGAAAFIFVWFMVSWGFGYSRVPLAEKIVVHPERVTSATVDAFANHVADELAGTVGPAHRERVERGFEARLVPSFEATIHRFGDVARFAPPRIKPTLFQPLMELSATSGFTDPWTHEINVDASALPYERPAYYAHEWGHISGFNDEAEANFIAAIACTRSHDPVLVYAGWLLVWFNLPSDAHVTHPLGRLAYADVTAIRARVLAHMNRHVVAAQHDAYDAYLKSNHVAAGYASYQLFIRWMVGADFDRDGLPRVRPQT